MTRRPRLLLWRAQLVKDDELVTAVTEKHIAGAVLDVCGKPPREVVDRKLGY